MHKVSLYTKLNCHLCEQAYAILLEAAWETPLEIDLVDITHPHNEKFFRAYFDRIPVITRPDSTAELGWPFTLADVKAYLAAGPPGS